MNKFNKIGLIFQIPNIAFIIVVSIIFLLSNINWTFLHNYIGWIIFLTIYGLMNITSIIMFAIGRK